MIQRANLFVAMGESAHLAGRRVVIRGNSVPEVAYSQQEFGDGRRTKAAAEGIGMDKLVVLFASEGQALEAAAARLDPALCSPRQQVLLKLPYLLVWGFCV